MFTAIRQAKLSGMLRKLILSSCVLLVGCGYTFQGGGSVLPPDVTKIYIPTAQNNSTELGLAQLITQALQEQFDSYGVVQVVDKQAEADAVLRAKIMSVKRTTRTSTSRTDTALQLETTLTLAAELARVTGPVLWRENALKVSKVYGTDPSVVVTSSADFASGSISGQDINNLNENEISRGQEQEVLARLSEDVARQVYDQAVSPDF